MICRVVSTSISQSLNQVSLVKPFFEIRSLECFRQRQSHKHQTNHPICQSLKRELGSPRMNHYQEFCFFVWVEFWDKNSQHTSKAWKISSITSSILKVHQQGNTKHSMSRNELPNVKISPSIIETWQQLGICGKIRSHIRFDYPCHKSTIHLLESYISQYYMHHLGNSYEPRVPRFLDDSWLEYLDKYSKTPKSLTHASNWTDWNHAKQQDYGDEDPWHPIGVFFNFGAWVSPKRKTTGTWDNITPKGKGETSTNHQLLASMIIFQGCTFEWQLLMAQKSS